MGAAPIHTRSIRVEVGPEREGRREARGRVLDRRHRGLTYVGSSVVGPGPVHDMSARLLLDVAGGRVESARGAMARAAFDGSPMTRFESCRDILPNLADLAGAPLDGALARAVRAAIGRERGCYHLTTMVLAVAPVVARVARERPAPEVTLARALRFEAFARDDGAVGFEGQLADADSTGRASEARLRFRVDPRAMTLSEVRALAAPALRPAPQVEAALTDVPLLGGFAKRAMAQISPLAGAEELLELALGCNAITTQAMILVPVGGDAPARPNRATNTCWMWRSGGPLEAVPAGRGGGPP